MERTEKARQEREKVNIYMDVIRSYAERNNIFAGDKARQMLQNEK